MQTREQIDLDNLWAATGYEDLGIGFNHSQPCPDSLRRFLDGEETDLKANRERQQAADYWDAKDNASRFNKFLNWFAFVSLVLAVLFLLYL